MIYIILTENPIKFIIYLFLYVFFFFFSDCLESIILVILKKFMVAFDGLKIITPHKILTQCSFTFPVFLNLCFAAKRIL